MKSKTLTALVWQEDDWFIARSIEVEVASQGQTRSEAIANLKEAVELYFEDDTNQGQNTQIKSPQLETLQVTYA